jgi:AraC family transcriptional regulator of adaptative response / DNA-3-methyladenine glycosylase II
MSSLTPFTRQQLLARPDPFNPEYDGRFVVGVRTTGIYCLPSCRPPRLPKPENIDYYATPEDARAAGLRACKLCRPDDFYLGYHAGEALTEDLLARMRREPGGFRTTTELARAAGVGTSKLHGLFRTHYHTTPADALVRARVAAVRHALLAGSRPVTDIAFETGFESLSAFNANFRRFAALNPARFRRIPEDGCFELALPKSYPIERTLAYLGRDRAGATERVEGRTLTAALRLGAGHAVVRVEVTPGAARCHVMSISSRTPDAWMALHERLLALLGLNVDPLRFESHVLADPDLAPLIDGQRGLRVPQIPDPFDGLIWTIAGQQITVAYAATLRRRLIERLGEPVAEDLFVPPTPGAVAALGVDYLTALGFTRSKASYLIDTAGAVASGALPLEALRGASATRIERELRAVRGIGPWSANYLLMRCYGFVDCVPLGDVVLLSGLKELFALPGRPGRDETLALMRHFSPYRSLATFHIWQRANPLAAGD